MCLPFVDAVGGAPGHGRGNKPTHDQTREENQHASAGTVDFCSDTAGVLSMEFQVSDVQKPKAAVWRITDLNKAPVSVSWRCARCVAVCEMREVTSMEEGHDVERVTETMRAIRRQLRLMSRRQMSSTLWRCHRSSTSTRQWKFQLCVEDGDFCSPDLCVPEICDIRTELVPWMDRQL